MILYSPVITLTRQMMVPGMISYYIPPNMVTSWWHHQMEAVSVLLALCAGNSPVTGEFPSQRPVTRSFDVFFDLCLNKQLRTIETPVIWEPSFSLWRHCNGGIILYSPVTTLTRHLMASGRISNYIKPNLVASWWRHQMEDAGHLRRHCARYGVTVMCIF